MKKPINKPLGIAIGSVITILFTLSAFTVLTHDTSADMKETKVAELTGWDKLNYGDDLYGLPNIAVTDVERQFDRNHSVSFVTKDVVEIGKITWDRLNYGDDLYGLPIADKFHG